MRFGLILITIFAFWIKHGTCEIKQINNVCSTFIDYFHMDDNPNCWFDPDVDADMADILKNHNYPMEVYNVTTPDGYILTLYRIVKRNAKEVFVLEPPMTGTGASYMRSGNKSLAFALYEAGYDVWLPSSRGTYYSQNHKELNDSDVRYWDFSFHELGVYDFPTEFELISNVTRRKDLIVVSYSMAGTAAAIYASVLPEHAKEHVKLFMALAPTIYVSKNRIPRLPINIDKLIEMSKGYFQHVTIFPTYDKARHQIRRICVEHRLKILCVMMGISNAGGTPDNFDPANVPTLESNLPTRVSLKIIYHYLQISQSNQFQQYDYGPVKNLMRYNSLTPPRYPLENVKVPFYIIYGDKDASCTVQSVERIYAELSDEGKMYGKYSIKNYNHFDVLFAKTAKKEVVDYIIQFVKEKF